MSDACGRCGWRPMPPQALHCAACGAPAARLAAETSIGPNPAWPVQAPQPARNAPYSGPVSSFPGPRVYGSPYPAQAVGPPAYQQRQYAQPPRPAKRTPIGFVAVLAVLVVLAGGGGAYWFLLGRTGTATAAPVSAANPVAVAGDRAVQAAPVAPAAAPPLSAGDQLATQVERDQPTVESVVGQWVPQIGSKQVGTVANGVTYDDVAIWNDVLSAKNRFPQAVVLRSDGYSSFKRPGFWVTIVATPFSSAVEANAWCTTNGLGRDDCFAKRLSHSEGPQGNTVPR